ncbi:hypothetical protein Q3G72_031607 [Acer saccharum]|nr:hypothetical protein Q3G72_031607 [Acer saccharum]
METRNCLQFLTSLSLALLCYLHHLSAADFTPADNYLLNCGSTTNASFYNRVFLADGSSTTKSVSLSTTTRSISLKNPNPSQDSPALYNTARVFTGGGDSIYRFHIRRNGTHLVRFHFSPFVSQVFNLNSAKFSVFVGGFLVLGDFSTQVVVVKEFVVKVEIDVLEIMFRPVNGSGFGFVNAIEVFSAPNDFIIDDGARFITASGATEEYTNLSSRLQESRPPREPREDGNENDPGLPTPSNAPQVSSGIERVEGVEGDGSSDLRTSQVFSQLITNEGR